MKTLFRFLIAAICLFIQTYPAHAQWIQINAPGFLIGSLVASGSNLIAGAYSPGGVFVSSNRGVSWSRVDTLGLDLTTPAIAVDSNGVGGTDVFLIRGTRTFRSTDDGISWSVTGVLTPSAVFDLVALDRRLFIATIHGLFRSSDDGATWMPIPGPEYMAMQIAVSSNGMGGAKLFVGPYLRVSTDDGTTWTQMNTFGHATRSLFVSGRTVLAGLDHGVLRSTDNGISWAIANTSFLPSVDVFVAYESGKFFASFSQYGVWMSADGGASWAPINNGLPNVTLNVLAADGTNLYTEANGIMCRRSLSELVTSVKKSSADVPTQFGLAENYPNPFNPSTTISFSIPRTSRVILTIVDALGRTRAELVNEEKSAGTYQTKWNANVPSGIYFYRLQAGEYVETKKNGCIEVSWQWPQGRA